MRLTENMIIARSKQSDLSTIKRINLWGCDLTDISIVENMTNIEVLALSINNLSCLQPLESCARLQVLYLRKNNIADFQELKYLQNLPMLTELWLAENPCAVQAGSNYRACVIKMLPKLKKLDDEEITSGDIAEAKKLDLGNVDWNCCPHDLLLKAVSPNREREPEQREKIENSSPTQEFFQESTKSELKQKIENVIIMQQQSELNVQTRNENQQPQREGTPISPQQCKAPQPQQQHFPNSQKSPPLQPIEDFGSQLSLQSLPLSFTPQIDDHSQDMHILNKTQSLSQIPQLKLILQIQPPQGTMDRSLNIEYPKGIDRNSADVTPRNRYDSVSERVVNLNRNINLQRLEHGSHTSRTRVSQGIYHDLGWESFSNCNRETRSPKSQRHFPSLEGSQSSRSMKNVDNLAWDDGLQTSRSNSSRASETTSTLHSSRCSRRNANVLSALLCVVPELDIQSLQVLEHSIQCRLDELNDV